MASCGISLNLSALEASVSSHIETVIGFAGLSGIPFLPSIIDVAVAISSGNLLAAIKIMVPPEALDTLWSGMRTKFAEAFALSDVPSLTGFDKVLEAVAPNAVAGRYDWKTDPDNLGLLGDNTFFGKLANIGTEFVGDVSAFAEKTGLDQLSGYVDIDITDLAKSAIGLGASFDECDFGTSGIKNYFRDPATGTIKLLANYAPKLGDTSVAAGNNVFGLALEINNAFKSGKAKNVFNANVQLRNVATEAASYAIDEFGKNIGSSSDIISEKDLQKLKQFASDHISPSSTDYSIRRTPYFANADVDSLAQHYQGARQLINPEALVASLEFKLRGVIAISEYSKVTFTASSFAT